VALKMVGREGKSAARAEREAKAAAALRHRHCQRIYALARDPAHVFIAYEYVPGRTMRQALAAGELDDHAAVEVAAQVLDALAHAHGRGIVHRDVKPSNVLLAEGDALDVRLLDFGLAQMAEFDTLTAIGDVPGTLAYVSPERLLGREATEAADVWAVGVMLWEALAGAWPAWPAATLPFYPSGSALPLAAGAGALAFASPRAGTALALAVAFFPLANISFGLALLFAAVAAAWFVFTWRDERSMLLLAAGPLLAPLGLLGLLPLAAQATRGTVR